MRSIILIELKFRGKVVLRRIFISITLVEYLLDLFGKVYGFLQVVSNKQRIRLLIHSCPTDYPTSSITLFQQDLPTIDGFDEKCEINLL